MRKINLYILLMVFSCGCTTTLYDWGSYEKSLYTMYRKVDAYNLHEDIDRLSVEIEKTVSDEKHIPPGKMAHLGYLFFMTGDSTSAIQHFEAEKRLFPESERFMDRMLERLQ